MTRIHAHQGKHQPLKYKLFDRKVVNGVELMLVPAMIRLGPPGRPTWARNCTGGKPKTIWMRPSDYEEERAQRKKDRETLETWRKEFGE